MSLSYSPSHHLLHANAPGVRGSGPRYQRPRSSNSERALTHRCLIREEEFLSLLRSISALSIEPRARYSSRNVLPCLYLVLSPLPHTSSCPTGRLLMSNTAKGGKEGGVGEGRGGGDWRERAKPRLGESRGGRLGCDSGLRPASALLSVSLSFKRHRLFHTLPSPYLRGRSSPKASYMRIAHF
jgi:hypothetical protein